MESTLKSDSMTESTRDAPFYPVIEQANEQSSLTQNTKCICCNNNGKCCKKCGKCCECCKCCKCCCILL